MPKYQRNRVYSLIVGKKGDAVEINNLNVKFSVTKTSNNKDKKNKARVEIYNLSDDRRRRLEEENVYVSLRVGYADALGRGEELTELFSGQVVNIKNTDQEIGKFFTKRQNTNLITVLDIDELFTSLNGKVLSNIVPEGKTVKDVIQAIIQDIPEVTRQEMNGQAILRQVVDGYPLTGTPKQNLDKLSKEYNLEWQIDSGVLYVSDIDGSFSDNRDNVPLIGQMSGLIERPEFINPDSKRIKVAGDKDKGKVPAKNKTLRMKILLNPTIIAGSIVKLDFEDLTGYYKVTEVKHEGEYRGNTWYSTLICEERV
jgi:hypothetical protein